MAKVPFRCRWFGHKPQLPIMNKKVRRAVCERCKVIFILSPKQIAKLLMLVLMVLAPLQARAQNNPPPTTSVDVPGAQPVRGAVAVRNFVCEEFNLSGVCIDWTPMVQTTAGGSSSGDGLTDDELRASPVPVSGDWLTDAELRASDVKITLDGESVPVTGNVAHDAADSGAPVKIGGRAYSGSPASVTNQDRVDAWLTAFGALNTQIVQGTNVAVVSGSSGDGQSVNNNVLWTKDHLSIYNGTTWDRARGDITNGIDVDVTRISGGPVGTHANAWSAVAVSAGGESTVIDMQFSPNVSAFGSSSAATTIELRVSQNGTNFYTVSATTLAGAGDFGFNIPIGARYARLRSGSAATITATIAGKQ